MRPPPPPLRAQVDGDWILRRLEQWGRREGMPFVGPAKGRALAALAVAKAGAGGGGLRGAVEVGTMAGYSAITLGRVRKVAAAGRTRAASAVARAPQPELAPPAPRAADPARPPPPAPARAVPRARRSRAAPGW